MPSRDIDICTICVPCPVPVLLFVFHRNTAVTRAIRVNCGAAQAREGRREVPGDPGDAQGGPLGPQRKKHMEILLLDCIILIGKVLTPKRGFINGV